MTQCNGQIARLRSRGFSLVELLIVVAVIALLLSILLPGLQQARAQSRSAVCGSNLRQLALANTNYANDYTGRFCPAAADIAGENLQRWHGGRPADDAPFDPRRGPLAVYLGDEQGVRACPEIGVFTDNSGAFERGGGGYGYNQAYVGRVVAPARHGNITIVTTQTGTLISRIRRPAETLMFADTAFAARADGVIEYSFAEPRFHPQYTFARMDPSIHFRHRERANVVWIDGHVAGEQRTLSWRSGAYTGDPDQAGIGWFGVADDNRLFDLD